VSHSPDTAWLVRQLQKRLTTAVEIMLPSEWAEAKRYLPPSATSLPGFYRFDVVPYWREVIDCLSPESDVRHVTIMKGVQVGATTLLENTIGYYIAQVKTAPMMLVTADAELAQLRMETAIVPMIKYSGLDHLVRSLDEQNPRKTGRTDKKYEWEGGGFLVPLGAVNANKLRSIPIQVLLRDEIDGWPDTVGKDGDPVKLSADRTAAYEASRKVFDCSTPNIKGQSKIDTLYQAGDQRKYFVRCLSCRHPQVLRWRRDDADTGARSGIVWKLDDEGRIASGSVRYLCEACGHPHANEDKSRLFAPDNAEWRPTATAETAAHRSYHLSALYSPIGMQTWEACAVKWREAWDDEHNRPKDNARLQVFYNNVLGEAFEVRGMRLRLDIVEGHRRQVYRFGEIPNQWCIEFCGSRVLVLTCAVDVHLDNLAVAVVGWCLGRRAVLVDYFRFHGETESVDDDRTWGRLRELIEQKTYKAQDGRDYRITLTLIDSGYLTDTVHRFCERYEYGVFAVRGRVAPPQSSPYKEFWSYEAPTTGQLAWSASVDMYKDRWASALRRQWDGLSLQPEGHFNVPADATNEQLKELTVETRRAKVDPSSGRALGFTWHRPSGADNELWDLVIYNNVALDILAFDLCMQQMGLEQIDWDLFYRELAAA
jgi:phage terminase large subunit GpA-like protein